MSEKKKTCNIPPVSYIIPYNNSSIIVPTRCNNRPRLLSMLSLSRVLISWVH